MTGEEKALAAASRVKLMAFDVDGVLTDGVVYYSAGGEAMKSFSLRDGYGLELLGRADIAVALITREDSPIVAARAAKLKLKTVCMGVKDKAAELRRLAVEKLISAEEIGYMGDDLFDIDALKYAGFSAAPNDAQSEVIEVVDYVCRRGGGQGAVREVADLIMKSKHRTPCEGV